MLPANHPGFNQHPDYFEGYYDLQQQKDAIATWNIGKNRKIIPVNGLNDKYIN